MTANIQCAVIEEHEHPEILFTTELLMFDDGDDDIDIDDDERSAASDSDSFLESKGSSSLLTLHKDDESEIAEDKLRFLKSRRRKTILTERNATILYFESITGNFLMIFFNEYSGFVLIVS